MGIRGNNNISHQPHDSEKLMCSHTNAASHQYSVAMLIEKRSMHQSNQECCVWKKKGIWFNDSSILNFIIFDQKGSTFKNFLINWKKQNTCLFFWIGLVIQTMMIAKFSTPYVKSLQINILISQQMKIQNGLNH